LEYKVQLNKFEKEVKEKEPTTNSINKEQKIALEEENVRDDEEQKLPQEDEATEEQKLRLEEEVKTKETEATKFSRENLMKIEGYSKELLHLLDNDDNEDFQNQINEENEEMNEDIENEEMNEDMEGMNEEELTTPDSN